MNRSRSTMPAKPKSTPTRRAPMPRRQPACPAPRVLVPVKCLREARGKLPHLVHRAARTAPARPMPPTVILRTRPTTRAPPVHRAYPRMPWNTCGKAATWLRTQARMRAPQTPPHRRRPVRPRIPETIPDKTPKIPGTLDAAALCKMAQRGQIKGGLLDGPLAFDNAINLQAAKTKGIDSPVAGIANILLVPDLEAGNMLAKNLVFLNKADAAGIVLGARAPIILTSRADNVRTRMASCAVAVLFANAGT